MIQTPQENSKRRRITRACDTCRRRKVRCDGGNDHEGQCASCVDLGLECTWHDDTKKRGRPNPEVVALKERVKQLEEVIRNMRPQGQIHTTGSSTASSPWTPQSTQDRYSKTPPIFDNSSDDDDEEDDLELLTSRTRRLELDALSFTHGVGTSNGNSFRRKVEKLRDHQNNPDITIDPQEEPDFWESHVREQLMRWQTNTHFSFPDADLLPVLVDAYMLRVNILWPLLHRPTFERGIRRGLHLSDPSFGSLVLLVCAHGARFVDDPRACPAGATTRAAGWQWFVQVDISRRDLFRAPRLADVQSYLLAALYGGAMFRGQLSWILVGIAIRMIQQVGAHSKKVYSVKPNATDELWKRCFWIAYTFDISMASETGRPAAISETDFDLEFPIDCDDEYWETENPTKAFKQPTETPSVLSFFIHSVKLRQTQLRAMRSLFSPGFALKPGMLDDVVMDIDSQLNNWLESTPTHLHVDVCTAPERVPDVFRSQAALLRMEHNHLMIVVHRPFIAFDKTTSASLAAHALCTTAARGNARLLDVFPVQLPQMLVPAMNSVTVLLVGLWGANKLNVRVDLDEVMMDVHRCRNALRQLSPMFQVAESVGARIDRLIASAPPQQSQRHTQKRRSTDSEHRVPEHDWIQQNSYVRNPHVPVVDVHVPHDFGIIGSPPPVLPSGSEAPTTSILNSGHHLLNGTTAFWDQDFLAFFDQMGPQYPLLQTDVSTHGGGSWGEYQSWGF